MDALRGLRSDDRGPQRIGLAAGLKVVVGDPGGHQRVGAVRLGVVLQRAGEHQVQLGVLARQRVVVHDLAQQRMPEAVATAIVGHDDVGLGGLSQGSAQLGRGQPAGVREDVVRQQPAGRQQAQQLLRGRR